MRLCYWVEFLQLKLQTGIFLILVIVAYIISVSFTDPLFIALTNKFYYQIL